MAKTIATVMGALFLLVGIIGLLGVADNMLGFHLSVAHDLIHLVTGAVFLYIGLRGTLSAARMLCIAFGAVYLLLGLAGFLFGTDQASTMPGMTMGNTRLLRIIPGQLELGTVDHVYHIITGLVFLIGGLMTKSAMDRTGDRT
jgi:hypothetical protein